MQGFSPHRTRLGVIVMLVMVFISACASPISPPLSSSRPLEARLTSTTLAPAISTTTSATATPPAPATATAAPQPTRAATATSAPQPTRAATATSTPAPVPARQPFDPALAAELQRILDATVADGSIPGAVLAVTIPGAEPWAGASGLADRQRRLPMQPDTRVRIASISKVFTAVVVLQLVEEGLIDIDAPMTTWLPDLVPNGDQITVRTLLNHTTGLYDFVEDRQFINRGYHNPRRVWQPRELVAYTNQFHPAFAPGARGAWDYSSTNYVILGMIVEEATGRTLGQEMHARIFAPLKLDHTFFAPEDEVQGQQARGYIKHTDQTNISMSIVFATANIVSTVSDVQQFAQALLHGQLLRPATLELMYEFKSGHGQYNMPDLAYGNGIMRNRLPVGLDAHGRPRPAEASTVVGHIGGFGGFRSAMWTAPQSGITVALGMNQGATDPNILATRVFDAILRHQ